MTFSDAFAASKPAIVPGSAQGEGVGARARVRARLPVTLREGKIGSWVASRTQIMWSDMRSSWWWPRSIPTLRQAWAQRMPDRGKVPGGHPVLFWAWVVYNHTVPLLAVTFLYALIGAVTPLVWSLLHPARALLAAVAAAPPIVIWISG